MKRYLPLFTGSIPRHNDISSQYSYYIWFAWGIQAIIRHDRFFDFSVRKENQRSSIPASLRLASSALKSFTMSSRLLASLTATAGFRKYFSADKKQSIVSKKDRSVAACPLERDFICNCRSLPFGSWLDCRPDAACLMFFFSSALPQTVSG